MSLNNRFESDILHFRCAPGQAAGKDVLGEIDSDSDNGGHGLTLPQNK